MDDTSHEPHFLVPISVQLRNRVGALSHITRLLENMRVNIEDINISGDSDIKNMYFLLQVENEKHLDKIMDALNNQAQVINVTRTFEK
jgi:(p)ppGpp synthase/HD superfamily hydrolase